ncbi:hypothetical protein [Streptomyces pseudovenezuelae]|uniref:Secreted protein n=1 Tax=Streptomyces pseudovenezuelae TaxID=67350 RepID=A0ABT6LFU3_9ACTN|nr:hypothetical protein [Streptomyces pseudovenezuelae]MDH6215178.1 hypothetical protein [Streptomyces pseudovenezuelae]
MLRTTRTHGRRGAVLGTSAAVVCLGAALAACGGGGGEGYVATGSAGGAPQASGTATTPTGGVTLVPLDGPREESNTPAGSGASPGIPAASAPDADGGAPGDGAKSGRTTGNSPAPTRTPTAEPPPEPTPSGSPDGPAALSWSEPTRKATDERWCEDVTVAFANSGGSAVRSGSVTFGTHVIGALGIDWATLESTVELPVPIAAGARKEKTWTVCVDAWRVPLGMHIETRDVTVQWK